jgi:hypothetical protein
MEFDDPTFGGDLPTYLTNPDDLAGYGDARDERAAREHTWIRDNAERMVIMPDGSVWGIVGSQAASWAVDASTGKVAAPYTILYLYDPTGQRPSPVRGAEPSHPDYVPGVTALRTEGKVVSVEDGTAFAASRRTGTAENGGAGDAVAARRGVGSKPGQGRGVGRSASGVMGTGRGDRAAGAKLPGIVKSSVFPTWAIPVGLLAVVGAYLGYRYYKAKKMRALGLRRGDEG